MLHILLSKQTLFVLLSLADFTLTYRLLTHSSGQIYEANPVAQLYLARYGWVGLALFKITMVLVVLGLVRIIFHYRPQTASRLLALGCMVLAGVVGYSAVLSQVNSRHDSMSESELLTLWNDELEQHNRETLQRERISAGYRKTIAELCDAMIKGKISLQQAAEHLADTPRGRDPAWRKTLALGNPGRSLHELFAMTLLTHAVVSRADDTTTGWRIAEQLEREFVDTFGTSPGDGHRQGLHAPPSVVRHRRGPAARAF